MAGCKGNVVSWDPRQQGGTPRDDAIRAHMPALALSTPLPLGRDVEERITSLGPVRHWPPSPSLMMPMKIQCPAKSIILHCC